MRNSLLAVGLTTIMAAGSAFGDAQIDFDIKKGVVVPTEDFAVMVSVLGAAITINGTVDVPVTVRADIGDVQLTPWGSFNSPADGDINTHSPARHFVYTEMLEADTDINIAARSWLPASYGGRLHLSVSSQSQTGQVKVLRNGDVAPNITGFAGQSSSDFYIRQYLADGRVNIHENQVIYLFELGTTNIKAKDADFQDLVVLITLGEDVDSLLGILQPLYD